MFRSTPIPPVLVSSAFRQFNVIMAERISPQQAGDLFMDKGEFENELKQVIGDLRGCHDLGNGNIIVLGRDGILCAGADMLQHDALLLAYLSLLSREVFLRSYFVRMFILDDLLKRIRQLLLDHHSDPNSIAKVRDMLNQASRDIILLQEILAYLRESLIEMEDLAVPTGHGGKRLFKVLAVGTMRRDILMRCVDLNKLCEGTHAQLKTLQQMTDVINTNQLEEVFENVNDNTKFLVDASAANERSSASLEVMQVICAGSFAFDIVDRLSGGTLNIVVPAWVDDLLIKPFISKPFVWWLVATRVRACRCFRCLAASLRADPHPSINDPLSGLPRSSQVHEHAVVWACQQAFALLYGALESEGARCADAARQAEPRRPYRPVAGIPRHQVHEGDGFHI